jgi:hypothetical protein
MGQQQASNTFEILSGSRRVRFTLHPDIAADKGRPLVTKAGVTTTFLRGKVVMEWS